MNLYLKIIIYFFFIFCGSCTDKKNKKTAKLPYAYEGSIESLFRLEKYDEVRNFANEALKDIKNSNLDDKAYLLYLIGQSFENSYHYDSAVYYCNKAFNLARKSKTFPLQALTGSQLLSLYNRSIQYKPQQDSLYKTLWTINDNELPENIKATLLNTLACCHSKYEEKEIYLLILLMANKSAALYLESHTPNYRDSLNMAYLFMNTGDAYTKSANWKQAIYNLKKSRLWIKNNSPALVSYYGKMASYYGNSYLHLYPMRYYCDSIIYIMNKSKLNFNDPALKSRLTISDYYFYKEKNFKLSAAYLKDAKTYVDKAINPIYKDYIAWSEADICLNGHQYRKALQIFHSFENNIKYWTLIQQMTISHSIALCYNSLNMPDSAIIVFNNYYQLVQKVHDEVQKNNAFIIEAKLQNKIDASKIEQQKVIIEFSRKQKIWLLIALILMSLSVCLFIIIYRNKKKSAQKLDEQNKQLFQLNNQLNEANETKSKLFGIISHDLRSPISQVYQLLRLQHSSNTYQISNEEKEQLEEETRLATANLLDSMEELLIWSKTQMKIFEVYYDYVNLNNIYMKCKDLFKPQILNKKLQMIEWIAPQSMVNTDANFLLTILRNVMHNAIKSSPEQGEIIVSFERNQAKKTISCIKVINQGKSFTQQDYHNSLENSDTSHLLNTGLGLQIVDELSRKINIDVHFSSIAEVGTCCTLTFPPDIDSS